MYETLDATTRKTKSVISAIEDRIDKHQTVQLQQLSETRKENHELKEEFRKLRDAMQTQELNLLRNQKSRTPSVSSFRPIPLRSLSPDDVEDPESSEAENDHYVPRNPSRNQDRRVMGRLRAQGQLPKQFSSAASTCSRWKNR